MSLSLAAKVKNVHTFKPPLLFNHCLPASVKPAGTHDKIDSIVMVINPDMCLRLCWAGPLNLRDSGLKYDVLEGVGTLNGSEMTATENMQLLLSFELKHIRRSESCHSQFFL